MHGIIAFLRCAISVAFFPNKKRYVYRTTTRFSLKAAEGHNAGCVMYAPRHKCICMKIEAEAENSPI